MNNKDRIKNQGRFDRKGFLDFMRMEERSQSTIVKYAHELELFFEFLDGKKPDKEELLRYREHIKDRYKASTVNGKLSAVNLYLRYTGREDMRVRFLRVQKRAYIDASRELTETEYKRLLETAREMGNMQLYYMMMTLCSTGIRISELSYVTLEAVKEGWTEIGMKGKYRVIIFPHHLSEKLIQYAGERGICGGYIFCTRSGRPLDRSNICHAMKRVSRAAGIQEEKVYPHSLRHLFARSFYSVEKDIAHLADLLGHSSIETTRIYVAASIKEHERILNQMNTGIQD